MQNETINRKKAMIQSMIAALQNNEKVIHRFGGYTVENMGEELKFQQSRLDELTWCEEHTREEIEARKTEHESQLTPEEFGCTYGLVRGLALEKIILISKIELLELALSGR